MPSELVKLLLFAAVAFVAYNVLVKDGGLVKNSGMLHTETYVSGGATDEHLAPEKKVVNGQINDVYQTNPNVLQHPQMSNSYSPQGNFEPNNTHNFAQLDCFPKDQLVASDLLPTEGGFLESNPATQGQLMNRNLFESGHHGGLNTQGGTNRNSNRQIRSDPLIPRRDVGPWSQSTLEPNTNRRPFEIGGC
jgi:hypothetical protein